VINVEVIASVAGDQKIRLLPVGGLLPRRNACITDQFRRGLLRCVS
jgi:hypothetical protein